MTFLAVGRATWFGGGPGSKGPRALGLIPQDNQTT